MLAIGLCALQLMLDRGQHKDWLESTEIVVELLIVISRILDILRPQPHASRTGCSRRD